MAISLHISTLLTRQQNEYFQTSELQQLAVVGSALPDENRVKAQEANS